MLHRHEGLVYSGLGMNVLVLAPSSTAVSITVDAASNERRNAPETPAQSCGHSTNLVKRASFEHVTQNWNLVKEVGDLPKLVNPGEDIANWLELQGESHYANKTTSPEDHREDLDWDDDASPIERVVAGVLCNE